MLSETERKTLEDIEHQLCLEDPKLAHRLVHGSDKAPEMRRWPYQVVVGVLVAVLLFALVFALSILAFIAVVLAGAVLGAQWLHREWLTRKENSAGAES